MYRVSARLLVAPALALGLVACGKDVTSVTRPGAELLSGAASTSALASVSSSSGVAAGYTVFTGQQISIKPRTTSRSSRLTWSSSSSTVASVTNTGLVTGRAVGSATITASGAGTRETYAVTVQAPFATGISLTPATGSALAPGQTRQFTTSVTWSDLQARSATITYTATGGTIGSNGLFTAGQLAGAFLVIANCSCGLSDTAAVEVTVPAQLTRLSISPKTLTLAPGATQQFSASAQWSTGATTLPPVGYSATGGTVTSTGLYTAPTAAGTYRVIVAHTGGTARDTAMVTVGSSTATLTALNISPKTVTLLPGGQQTFTASASWSNGSATLPPVSYSATSGTVTSTGAYTAPAAAGTYFVVVAHSGGTLRDTATVVVGSNNTTTTTGGFPTAPWSVIRDFNSGTAGSSANRVANGFDDVAGQTFFSSERSFEGGMAARVQIDSGKTGFGNWGGILRFPARLVKGDEVWIDLQVLLPQDFVIMTLPKSLKFLRVHTKTATGGNSGYNDLYLCDDDATGCQFRFIKEIQNKWYPFGVPRSFTRNVWHRFTMHLRYDNVPRASGGQSQVRVWQNGVLMLDEHRVQTLTNATDYSDSFFLFTHWNGGAPKFQMAWVDNIRIANRRPAWVTGLPQVDNY